ncbi:hypothetical protein [Paenisporosarcina sp. TG20]|uniref:hypothetical protein n=1 Tax=Paenisporosarcina sp. TG20 TaxID=1211706 RepID=UPI0002F525F6|nr:hypothetical protein [Paenisporosarcina sp. TG20]
MIFLYLILILESIIFYFIKNFLLYSGNLELAVFTLITINSVLIIFIIANTFKLEEKEIFIIILISYFIRLIFLFIDIYGRDYFLFPNSGIDSESFHSKAIQFADFNSDTSGYPLIVGYIYKVFGPERLIAQYLNIIFSITVIFYLIKSMNLLEIGNKIKKLTIFIIAFIPNYIIMSSILLRESLLILFLTISLYFFIKWWKFNSIYSLFFSFFFVLIAAYLHSGAIVNALVYLIILLIYSPTNQRYKLKTLNLIIGFLIIIGFYLVNYFYNDMFFGYFEGKDSIDSINTNVNNYSEGDSVYVVGDGQINSILDLVVYTPIRMVYFISSPLPFQWRGINDIIAFLFSSMFYIITISLSIKAYISGYNKNIILVFLMLAVSSAFLYGWGVSNAGSALRHRDKFIINYALMLAISLDTIHKHRYKLK